MAQPIPRTMTAIEITEPGGPDVLKPVERPVPDIAPGEVLIRIAAAGLNGADLTQRRGRYPMTPDLTDIPGLEVSGTVVAIGKDAERFAIGDEICALIPGGGYAEFVNAPWPQCMAVPPGVSMVDSAGLPEVFCTVWTNLIDRCRLATGETVLVQGGTSGIGHAAIMLAKSFGCTVLATARNAEKCDAMKRFGADRAINYREEDFLEVGKEFTDGRGVDVILDIVGGGYITKELELLARDGRLVFVNFKGGAVAEADFSHIHRKHLTVTGSRLRPRSVDEKGEICRALEDRVWPLFADGTIRTETCRRFPLAEAAEAHRLMEASDHIGKVLLTV